MYSYHSSKISGLYYPCRAMMGTRKLVGIESQIRNFASMIPQKLRVEDSISKMKEGNDTSIIRANSPVI